MKISIFRSTVNEANETSILKFCSNLDFITSIRILAILQRIAQKKSFSGHQMGQLITKEELDAAKTRGIKIMQQEMFPTELRALSDGKKIDTNVKKFCPFLKEG